MNRDETRLKEIQDYKRFYHSKIQSAESELEHDLLQVQLDKLNDEETSILKRSDAI